MSERPRADTAERGRDIALDVADIWPDYQPTRLIELPALARATRVGRVLVKLESERPLGNFKALGGMVASLRALARLTGVARLSDLRGAAAAIDQQPGDGNERSAGASSGGLHSGQRPHVARLPPLVCASSGNHGLSVAAAARWVGMGATVFMAESANPARAARIETLGARVIWTPGTYDDAVDQAAESDGFLIADTSPDADDPVVRDVLEGYQLICRELAMQLGNDTEQRPTHLFVQAGVGGLAAALTAGLRTSMRGSQRVLVVEPESAACVSLALAAGRPVHIPGSLHTRAEMLACALASAPALKILRDHGAGSVWVSETLLQQATTQLGLSTTASGAAGLAGLLHVSSNADLRELHQLTEDSCVLLIVTEGAVPSTATIFGTS